MFNWLSDKGLRCVHKQEKGLRKKNYHYVKGWKKECVLYICILSLTKTETKINKLKM